MGMTNSFNKTNLDDQYSNSGGGLASDPGPYVGIVMDNHDPYRNGKVYVWLKNRGSTDRNNKSNWRPVSYLSPFYGTTPFDQYDTSESSYKTNGHSYGMWFTSPDVGVEVLCIFADGNPNLGYIIGYVPQARMNHMIPAIGARTTQATRNNSAETAAYAKASQMPTVEISESEEAMRDPNFYNSNKPVHSNLSAQFWRQGTVTDTVRGPIGTSVQRESPSYAYGISTPGRPVYADSSENGLHEGNMSSKLKSGSVTAKDVKVEGRRGGHSFVMDDGDLKGKDVLMRLRTATGHQITMSDDGAAIYIQHANGLTWMEFGNEGTVDIFSTNSINLRSQGEINLHADKNINFYSGQDINMFAERNIKLEAKKNFDVIGKLKTSIYSKNLVLIKSEGVFSTESTQKTTIKADGDIVEQGAHIMMNSGGADSVPIPTSITHTSLPDSQIKGPTGWESIPGKLDSIVTRAPTHEPYAFHNQGVPVPVVVGAPSIPPASPPPAKTQEAIKRASEEPPVKKPAEVADVAEQASETNGIEEIAGVNSSSIASTMSQHAKTLDLDLNSVTEAGAGKFGILPKTLAGLDLIKPGRLDLSLNPKEALNVLKDPGMFTGLNDINSLDDILNSEKIQSNIVQNGMSKAHTVLKQSGTLTGGEGVTETATMLGASMVATGSELGEWVSGGGIGGGILNTAEGIADNAKSLVEGGIDGAFDTVSKSIPATLDSAIAQVGKASQFATALAIGPAKEVVDGILDGAGMVKGITNVVGNVNMKGLDSAMNSLVGNAKIPSISDISDNIKSAIDPEYIIDKAGDLVESGLDEIGDLIKNPIDLVSDTLSGVGDALSDPGALLGGIATGVTGAVSGVGDLVADGISSAGDLFNSGITITEIDNNGFNSFVDSLPNLPTQDENIVIPERMLKQALTLNQKKIISNVIPKGVKKITKFI